MKILTLRDGVQNLNEILSNSVGYDNCSLQSLGGSSLITESKIDKCSDQELTVPNLRLEHCRQLEKLFINGTTHRHGWLEILKILSEIETSYLLIDYIDQIFGFNNNDYYIPQPWIGFWHFPPNIPEWMNIKNTPLNIIQKPLFIKWLPYCKTIFVFSDYLRNYLIEILSLIGGTIPPIKVIKHPSAINSFFKKDKLQRRILQIGYWLRKVTTIAQLQNTWEKVWLYGDNCAFNFLQKEINFINSNNDYQASNQKIISNVSLRSEIFVSDDMNARLDEKHDICNNFKKIEIKRVNNDQYDQYLNSSIIIVQFWDTSVNNLVIEAINHGTPIICNRKPAIIEILGFAYPLYADSPEQIDVILLAIDRDEIDLQLISNNLLKISVNYTYDIFRSEIIRHIKEIE